MAIRRERPSGVRRIRPEMPEAFDRLVLRCLEKNPERRIQTARDVYNELDAIKTSGESGASAAETPAAGPGATRECRVAVLPFANMSADPDQEYFCDGMAEEVINALAHVEGLQVAARTSAFAFKGQNRDVREIGRLLDVGSVLEGSVRRAGARLRITAQLVRVADGMHLWSERFDRQPDDVFAIQDEISLTIVDRLKVRLLPSEQAHVVKRHTVDPEAHNLYLKGRFFFSRRSEGDMARAMACYEQAKAQDPEYPLPYVGLADALLGLGQWAWLRPRDAFPKARTELERALALDEGLAEVHSSLGFLTAVYDWDWQRSERCFTRALSLNPRYTLGRLWHAILLCVRERFEEAIRESRSAIELEPLSAVANVNLGQTLLHAGRFTEAIEQLGKAVELDPHVPISYVWLMSAQLAAGRVQDAVATGEVLSRAFGPLGAASIAMGCAAAGRTDEARRAVAGLEQLEKDRYVGHVSLGFAYAAVGDTEACILRLERAFEERDPQLPFIKVMRGKGNAWESALADARVQAIIRKIGLPE